ncbi:hypothetical protein [Prochlorococcus sp. MIT 1223]|uniref:hypothetical protein n=1 Tax=Prochlorococcus sp. MIT 1223 TaxID=3096217 RepID=UPI002A751D66|nr:hypothetical protein [Prochlorococcus sp. MIT 1223]
MTTTTQQVQIKPVPKLRPKPIRIRTYEHQSPYNFIQKYREKKLEEVKVKSELIRVFFELLTPYETKHVRFITDSFWIVMNELYPTTQEGNK